MDTAVETFAKNCRVTEQYTVQVVQVSVEALVELCQKTLGSEHPVTVKWLGEQEKIHAHREKSHREAVAWDDWKDSLARNN
jgi:hypothetical protein